MSNNARDLLKKVLNTDPTKRYGAKEIKEHSWFNLKNIGDEPNGIIIGYN